MFVPDVTPDVTLSVIKPNWLQGWYYGKRAKFIGQYFSRARLLLIKYWPWRRPALLVEILAYKFCPSAVVPALQSIWFYNGRYLQCTIFPSCHGSRRGASPSPPPPPPPLFLKAWIRHCMGLPRQGAHYGASAKNRVFTFINDNLLVFNWKTVVLYFF